MQKKVSGLNDGVLTLSMIIPGFYNIQNKKNSHSYGLDWTSNIRHIRAPKDESKKNEELWPEKSSHLRTYPR